MGRMDKDDSGRVNLHAFRSYHAVSAFLISLRHFLSRVTLLHVPVE